MKATLNNTLSILFSTIISLVMYFHPNGRWTIAVICFIAVYIFFLINIYINNPENINLTFILISILILLIPIICLYLKNKKPNQDIQINEATLEELKNDFITNNYEHMLETAEKNHVMSSEIMLNVLGIMYAQGIYYEQNYEKAIETFNAATEYGNLESSFSNLWLVSYLADLNDLNNGDTSYSNSMHAIKVAEKHQNYSINEMLKMGISTRFNENVENGYEYIKKLTYKKRRYFFSLFEPQVDTTKYIACTKYVYQVTRDESIADKENNITDVKAIPTELEEREISIYMFRYFWPDNDYIAFDSIPLSPNASSDYKVTGNFKYETSYKDINGNTCFWIDTDEFYYGDIPPDTDENSRWVIDGYDKSKNVRIYKLQIKE